MTTPTPDPVIRVRNLTFRYAVPGASSRSCALRDVSFDLPPGSRCLLIGGNGGGKSTMLKCIGGRLLIPRQSISVLSRPAFHDTTLVGSVALLADWWHRNLPDLGVTEVLGKAVLETPRAQKLMSLLEVDPAWRMASLSDGQRRRVQIVSGLAAPKPVLLLDEVTAELDLLTRDRVLAFLRAESMVRGATVLYATHIFDAVADLQPTHVLRCSHGRVSLYAAPLVLRDPPAAQIRLPDDPSAPAGKAPSGAPSPTARAALSPTSIAAAATEAASAGMDVEMTASAPPAEVATSGPKPSPEEEAAGAVGGSAWYYLARRWLLEDGAVDGRDGPTRLPWQARADADLHI
eukprot:TRINITY_DN56604_c0_g1_i1.p1 TRINITY_DN56604_c0_g1~~TRINITY_DN56604_c0_g1_i1.p1  ORF type:complete len:347 (-),score=61.87 TRINITY_DN56604_c0_g1_i1:212-1252(-)